MSTVLIVAGDVSGDRHAAGFVRALRERIPDVRLIGLGGEALGKAGVERIADQSELAIGGLFELVGGARGVARAWRRVAAAVSSERPDLVVLVDSGGFNLPLARRVKRSSDARILYYVAPQVWAWRPGRIRKLARRVDRVALIHPFEVDFYRARGIPAEFVGHPLVDELAAFRAHCDRDEACRRVGLDPDRRYVALLPGSRRNEVTRHLPVALEAARRLHRLVPELGFVVGLAPSIDEEVVGRIIREAGLPAGVAPAVVRARTHEVIRAADVALVKPGTVTVEAMLLERPMVVIGIAHPLTAAIVRRLLRVPWLAMPNLLAGRSIVPELVQQEATPDRVAEAVRGLLDERAAERQRRDLAEAAARLGSGGAAERASRIAEAMLADRAA